MAPLKPSAAVRSSSSAAASGDGGRQRGEGGEARRIAGDDFVQPVVDAPRDVGRGVGGKFLRRRRAVREHLNVDAGFVHFFQPERAEVLEPGILLAGPAGLAAGKGLFQFVVPVMLFDGNDRTMRFLEQAALPFFIALCAKRGVVAGGMRGVITPLSFPVKTGKGDHPRWKGR
jgi:hypothetical protein